MAVSAVVPVCPEIFKNTAAVLLASLLLVGEVWAGKLTTFEEYALMNAGQQSAVRSRAAEMIYNAAKKQGDNKQVTCLELTFMTGPESSVKAAHAKLRKMLEAEKPDDPGNRVEYAMEDHFNVLCPPAAKQAKRKKLTTFAEYAAMTLEQRSKLLAGAARVIYVQALTKKDQKQRLCLRQTFLSKYSNKEDVQLAHARLRGRLEAAIENPYPKGRVEYLIAHHLNEVCPPTENQQTVN